MRCDGCGIENEALARFCRKCGSKINGTMPRSEDRPRLCRECGTADLNGVAFCRNCGSPFSAGPQVPDVEADLSTSAGMSTDRVLSVGQPVDASSGAVSPSPLPASSQSIASSSKAEIDQPSPLQSVGISEPPSETEHNVQPAVSPSLIIERKTKIISRWPMALGILGAILAVGIAVYSVSKVDVATVTKIDSSPALELNERNVVVEAAATALKSTTPSTIESVPLDEMSASNSRNQPSLQANNKHSQKSGEVASSRLDGTPPTASHSSDKENNSGAAKASHSSTLPLTQQSSIPPAVLVEQVPLPSETKGEISIARRLELLAKQSELCLNLGLVDRLVCVEKAKWRYCNPDLWGAVPQCPGKSNVR